MGLCSFDNGVEININVPYLRGRGMVSTTTYNKFVADCPVGTDPANPSQACNLDITTAHNEVGNVNIYNTIGDCIDGVNNQPTEGSKKRAASPVYARAPVPKALGGPIECIDEVYQQYINTASFQTAFHVAPLNWAVCGSK